MFGAPPREHRWDYTVAELWTDGVIHVVGTLLAAGAAGALIAVSAHDATAGQLTAVIVYLATLVLSLTLSAVYNIWPVSPTKWMLRRFDHSAIFLLIAGTYTPFMVLSGLWWLLGFVWTTAVTGIALKLLRPHRFDRLFIVLYLAMGWSGVLAYDELVASLPPAALWLVFAGGFIYSLGVVFHVWERLRFQNAIWHGFVLAGAGTHYAAVWVASVSG